MKAFTVVLVLMIGITPGHASRRRAVSRQPLGPPPTVKISDDFGSGPLGWESGFADYSPLSEGMELESEIRPLPPELGVNGTGFLLSGHNRSDDLFMFLTKKLAQADGVRPDQRYAVTFRIVFASRAGTGCSGIGGSPGESVFLKAGATEIKPLVMLSDDDHYRINVDKGNQSTGGPAASVAGNIANGSANCSDDAPFLSIERIHRHDSIVAADRFGEIWLLVGTDSGFEGKTSIYYQSIEATLEPAR